ncbi:MAG TPA: large conductance mechanosensitive channel protein MscL, partial [Acidimicrobiales bacterium]|nr:large conductance mechanosensitive channel protein MscL [Acidimicrobiales bacterium]
MPGLIKEFKDFISRGNVVDLAVAVVIGAAFTAVVSAFVAGLITPLIGMIGGTEFRKMDFTINGSTFEVGIVINALITFL